MFRAAFGPRSPSMRSGAALPTSPTAWTNTWIRAFNSAKMGLRAGLRRQRQQQQQLQQQQLHHPQRQPLSPLGGATRPSTSRPGLTLTRIQGRGFRFSAWRRNTTRNGAQENLSLSQRLKRLSKEYGWSAVGVYLALSVLDFPFCFLLVRIVGTDTIGKVEHYVLSSVSQFIPETVRQKWHEYRHTVKSAEVDTLGHDALSDKAEMAGWGVEEAQQHHKEEASLGTQLALAYAIHKSFIFFRVPLTAAVTPKVVRVLRSWGWNIGKRTSR
ncbi:hypothetical protein E4U41_007544 [Claviceps citrina]|nr:hypothetical protein E4U41_007544 [Claviceps citrina]